MVRNAMLMIVGAVLCLLLLGDSGRLATAEPSTEVSNGHALVPPTRIALIDMAKVFKASKVFEERREKLKSKIAESEEVAKKAQAEMQQMAKQSAVLEKGSEERKHLEARLKQKAEEFEEFRKRMSESFLKQESEIYLAVYRIVSKEVGDYAQAHGIDLVIRHNAEPLDDHDPKALLQGMNRQVVYENKLDITDEIITILAEQ